MARDDKNMAQDIRIYMRGLIQACREHAYLRLNQDCCEHAYLRMIQACWEHAYLLTWAQTRPKPGPIWARAQTGPKPPHRSNLEYLVVVK